MALVGFCPPSLSSPPVALSTPGEFPLFTLITDLLTSFLRRHVKVCCLVWLFYRMLVPVFSWKFQGLCSIVSIVDYIITFWGKPGIGCLLTEVVCWCLGEGVSSWWPCRRPPVPFSPLWSSIGPQSSSPQLPLSGVWWHNSLLCTWNLLRLGFSFLSWKPFFGHRDVGCCLWPRVVFPSFDARALPGSLSAAPLWCLHVSTSQSPVPQSPSPPSQTVRGMNLQLWLAHFHND